MGENSRKMFSVAARTSARTVSRQQSRNYSGTYFFPGYKGRDGLGAEQPNLQKEIVLATVCGVVAGAVWMNYAINDRAGYKNFYATYKPTEDVEDRNNPFKHKMWVLGSQQSR